MAQVTSIVDLTSAWTQIANVSQKYFFTVLGLSTQVTLRYASAEPTAGDGGHVFTSDDTFGDTPTEKVWIRANQGSAKIALTKD